MAGYLPDIIDGAVTLILAITFTSIFFLQKYPKLYKKKWLLLVAAVLTLQGGHSIYRGAQTYSAQRAPTRAEVEKSISQNGTLVLDDLIYSSPDGFKILIPSGFAYSLPGGAVSVMAVKDLGQNTGAALAVMKMNETNTLDQLISDISQLDTKGKTYSFNKDSQRQDLRRGYVEVERDGVSGKGAIALIKKGNVVYQIMLSTKKSHFEEIEPVFEKVLASFEVQ